MWGKDSIEIVCPRCQGELGTGRRLHDACSRCGMMFARVRGVPVLRTVAPAEKLDYSDDTHGLHARDSSKLPIPFVKEAMSSGGLVLELGAGHDVCDASHLVKTDAYLYSSQLDYVADGHCLPFASETFDYVYSLATFEHLHSPWVVASEIFRVLKPGGKVYTLAAFIQHAHGYPSHFFNMTEMGLRRVFTGFEILDCGPSRFTPFVEIAYAIADFSQIVRARRSQCEQRNEDTTEVARLERALRASIEGIAAVQEELMDVPEAHEAWRRIAPGLELIARRPVRSGKVCSHPSLEREPTVRHAALEREIEAMRAEFDVTAGEVPKAGPVAAVARRRGVSYYLREFTRTLCDDGWREALARLRGFLKRTMGRHPRRG